MPVPTTFDAGVGMPDKTQMNSNWTLLSSGGGLSTTTGITAHAGGTQAAGVALTAAINLITVCATGGDSVCLPSALGGQAITVCNAGAASCNVFSSNASTADTINGTAGTTAFAVGIGKNAEFISPAAGIWRAILSA